MKPALSILLLALLFVSTSNGEGLSALDPIIQKSPNIVLGKVYLTNDESFFIKVDWELRGEISSEIFEVKLNRSEKQENITQNRIKIGDKVLALINRELVAPLKQPVLKNFYLSEFDEFEGQSLYSIVNNDSDYPLISYIYSKVSNGELASAFEF